MCLVLNVLLSIYVQSFSSVVTSICTSSWPEPLISIPGYLGKKLLCADFSGGLEPIVVPCTNDVDNEPSPSLEYITKSRFNLLPVSL